MVAVRTCANPRLVLVGTSHRRAALDLRERLYVGADQAAALAASLAGDRGEAVVLSTCNRTELYIVQPDLEAARENARNELARLLGRGHDLGPALESVCDDEAALHLLRVAAGLESLVPGESQILGQVRAAHDAALGVGATGPVLNHLFRQALRAGKRVRSETSVSELPASVPAAAVELAQRFFGELNERRILIIGAGKMSELAVSDLVSGGVRSIVVANRTRARAESLARRFGGVAIGFERLGQELERADLVISSTRCPYVVLRAAEVTEAIRCRNRRPLVFIDLGVPRDLDPAIRRLSGCYLFDLDDLGKFVTSTLAERRHEICLAETIVAEEAANFREWTLTRDVVPTITSLRRRADEIRTSELARAETLLSMLSPRQRRAVEVLTAQIVSKLLHTPTVRLKEAAVLPGGGAQVGALNRLFGLDDDSRL